MPPNTSISGSEEEKDLLGIFTNNNDIGAPEKTGAASYDLSTQTYTITGAGYNIWGSRDEFRFVYNKVKGNFIATANFEFEGQNDIHRKIGWMARESSADNAAMVGGFLHGDGLLAGQWRESKAAEMEHPDHDIWAPKRFYEIIQLERTGKIFTVRAAHPGEALQEVCCISMGNLAEEVLLGLVICSHDAEALETARVWNVRIDQPVAEAYDPEEEGWLGCRMETMDVVSGLRKVIMEKENRFEAPNWMPDGDELLFNMDGSLFTIPAEGGEIKKVNTGTADDLNNDHCISFDGAKVGISHGEGESSRIYVLPLSGGEPKIVTEIAPSYLHGWAPNNEEVVYVARRNGAEVYDIYRSYISGGEEVKLTHSQKGEHVDGCEYDPDGKFIYYNGSTGGGSMQLWRMKADGSEKEQLTFDEYNDWFPHISPDGKWIAFISFPADIELNSHPSYKRVMLRLMPVSGGAPRVIAYLYGGQGTINVNSWSPDSKQLAFVSNSRKSS